MRSGLGRPPIASRVGLYARTGRRALHRYGFNPMGILGPLNPDLVFVVGCPRSGTTFTASALGSVPGFADLGEVKRLKAGIPGLYLASQGGQSDSVVKELRALISRSQRVAMAAQRRGIEQTPESTYLIAELAQAFPHAHFLHLIRDGRDVASSLVERGWLAGEAGHQVKARSSGEALDDAGHPFGGYARFWIENGRETDFENASEARRCAWAWRRYVTVALEALHALDTDRVTTVRYEDMAADPIRVATRVAAALRAENSTEELARALSSAHSRSVGNYVERLGTEGLADVLAEIGPLLGELGYPTAANDKGAD